MFPIVWVEEVNLLVKQMRPPPRFLQFRLTFVHFLQGVAELTPSIRRWIYLATVFGPASMPIMSYSMILAGSFMLMYVFVRAYKNFVFNSDPTDVVIEMGRRSIRRGSSFLIQHQHRIMMHHHQRDSYTLLKTNNNNENDLLP